MQERSDKTVGTMSGDLEVCQFDDPACRGQRGRGLAPVVSGNGRHAGQCPSCERVWYLDNGVATWVWDSYHGGYMPAGDPRAAGWRRVLRYQWLQLRVRVPRLSRHCGERLPRLRRGAS